VTLNLYFAGSEVSSWRKLLKEQDVSHVALSFVGLQRRVQGTDRWLLSTHYPAGQHIFLDSGAFSLNRQFHPDDETDEETTADEDVMDIATAYMAFVLNNIDRVDMVSEFDALVLGADWLAAMREDFYNELPPGKFMPIWHSDTGLEELQRLARRYQRVGILQTSLGERDLTTALNGLVTNYGVKLHGVGMTKMDPMREVHWDSVSSLSWISPGSYGDTFVWTGHELKRYPKRYKEQCRNRHRALFAREGFDAAKIIADAGENGTPDDKREVLRLSLWSWQKFVDDINHNVTMDPFGEREIGSRVATIPETEEIESSGSSAIAEVDTQDTSSGHDDLVPIAPIHRDKVLIPVMDIMHAPVADDAPDGTVGEPLMHVGDSTLLQCDNCFMKDRCPGFRPHHECLYEFPVEVTTITQTAAVMDGLIKMQTQRVLRMQLFEQVMGGDIDPNLSSEMDRLTKMIKQKYDANREGIDIHIRGSRPASGMGPISQYMGSDIAERMNARPEPTTTEQMAIQAGVIQGRVEE
jgi:hypothetical protein